MQKPPRLFLTGIATALLLLGSAAGVSAQRNPTMPSQQRDNEKEALYARYTEHRKAPGPEQQGIAYEIAKVFLRKFGGDDDSYAKEVKKFVTDYENGIHQSELYTAYSASNYSKTFELGRPLLKAEPENFFVLGVLAEAGYENALVGNASLNAETIDYARRAIQLMEAGKVTKADPFKSMGIARGFLNQALGWLLKDQSPAEAAAAFVKAAQSDSPYRNDPLTYYRLGIAILKGEFAQASAEYNEKYASKPSSPEQQAMFERVNHLGERAIDAYARAVALSDPQRLEAGAANNTSQRSEAKSDRLEAGTVRPQFPAELRSKILAQLTALYKSFHNNSDAGLNELISTVLSKPLP